MGVRLQFRITFGPTGDDESIDHQNESLVIEREDDLEDKPPMYKVLLINDDYTPMEFVVFVLQKVFHLQLEQAIQLMLTVHTQGVGVVGVFSHEIAETKATQVLRLAKQYEHPLMCSIEKDE